MFEEIRLAGRGLATACDMSPTHPTSRCRHCVRFRFPNWPIGEGEVAEQMTWGATEKAGLSGRGSQGGWPWRDSRA